MAKTKLFFALLFIITVTYSYTSAQNLLQNNDYRKVIESDIVQYSSSKNLIDNQSFAKENQLVDIGGFTGSSWGAGPLSSGGQCSYYQALYFQGEINITGKRIKSISYYMEGSINWNEKIEVYMGHTDSTRMSNWVEIDDLVRVFSGTITTEAPEGWLRIELTHPFEYNNEQNLIIGVIDNQDNHNIPATTYFWQTATDETSIYSGPKLSVGAGLTGPITAEFTDWVLQGTMGLRPDIRLEFEDIPDKALLRYEPKVADYIYYHDFGINATNQHTTEDFYIENIGKKDIVISEVTIDNPTFTCSDKDILIASGDSYTFTVSHNSPNSGEIFAHMKLHSDDSFDGDSIITLRSTVHKRAHLYESWEIKPEDFPPLGWDYTGITTPEDWFIYSNWYINEQNYPESFAYDRLSIVQSVGYNNFGRDTLITPLLDIKSGDSLTFYAYDSYMGGRILPIYYTPDKKTYTLLENVIFEGWDLTSGNPKEKWAKHVVDLSSIPGKYHLCFVEEETTLPHLDLVEGPMLALLDNDLLVVDIEASLGLTANTDNPFRVTIMNYGKNTANNYNIKLWQVGNPDIEIATIPGIELGSMGEKTYTINWKPTEEGNVKIYATIIANTDDNISNNKSEILDLTVYSNSSIKLDLNDDEHELSIYPLNFNWVSNLSQGLYFADELQIGTSTLHEMDLYIYMTQDLLNEKIRVWVGETDKQSLADGMIPADELQLVYTNDSVNFYKGEHTLRIPFSEPYNYTGKNLVFMIQKLMTDTYHSGYNQFHVSNNPKYKSRSITYYHRSIETDPYNPPSPWDVGSFSDHMYINFQWDFYADATFYFDTEGLGEINGKVTVAGTPLSDVDVKVQDTYFATKTDANGNYKFSYLNPGQVSITADKFGYNEISKQSSVIPGFYQTVDIEMTEKAKFQLSGTVKDHNSNLLSGAEVSIKGYENYDLITNISGNFAVNVWSDTSYMVTISKHGFRDTTFQVKINQTAVILEDIVMREIPAFPDMLNVSLSNNDALISWSKPNPAIAKEFRYDSGNVGGMLGFSYTDKAQLGTVFKNKALITEVSFYVTANMADDEAKIYIYGLNEFGKPDTKKLLHKSESFSVTKNNWNVYTLDVAIYAENGFYVGINSRGYLALGTATSTNEYPFLLETHYHTWSIDHPESLFYFFPSEYDGNIRNLMIRANGYDYGPVEFEFFSKGNAKMANTNEYELKIEDLPEQMVKDPIYKYNIGSSTKALEKYSIYRLSHDQLHSPELWNELATNINDTSFTDTEWSKLTKGVYYYAVKAHYDTGLESFTRKSERIGKEMEAEVNISFTLPEKTNLSNVQVTLKQLAEDGEVYYAGNLAENKVVFNKVWNDKYLLDIRQDNCYLHLEELDIDSTYTSVSVNLKKGLLAPVALSVKETAIEQAKFSWEEYEKQEVILDDGDYETGFFAFPAEYVEFGNRFINTQAKTITQVKVFGAGHPWAMRESKVYIKIYDQSFNLLGTSEPFELPNNNWVNVHIPYVSVAGGHYIMVCWDYILKPTNLLGIDIDGATAVNTRAAYVNDHWNRFKEFGSVGGLSGAFLIRPEYIINELDKNAIITDFVTDESEAVMRPYASLNSAGEAGEPLLKSTNVVNKYNVYLNDFTVPYSENILQTNYVFNSISGSHEMGVAKVNSWGESDISKFSYSYSAPSNDATLKNIMLDGVEFSQFSPEVFNYIVGYNGVDYPKVSATANDTNATVIIENNYSNYVNIKVFAADKVSVNNYALLFSKNTDVDQINQSNLKIYPNPASDKITVCNPKGGELKIFTLDGRIVLEKSFEAGSKTLSIEFLNSGNYVVKLIDENGIHTSKLSVQ